MPTIEPAIPPVHDFSGISAPDGAPRPPLGRHPQYGVRDMEKTRSLGPNQSGKWYQNVDLPSLSSRKTIALSPN